MVLRADFLTFRFLVGGGTGVEERGLVFHFLRVVANVQGPSFAVFFLPPFLGLSTSANIARISSVKGRKPETGSFLEASRILLAAATKRNMASGIEPTNENFDLSAMMKFVEWKIETVDMKESCIMGILWFSMDL